MELHGTVTLNEESMRALKNEVRKEVINEIKESGNTENEIELFLRDLSYKDYLKTLKNTLDDVLNKTKSSELQSDVDNKVYDILCIIYSLLYI